MQALCTRWVFGLKGGSKGVRDESGGDIPLTVPGTGTFIASFRGGCLKKMFCCSVQLSVCFPG